MSYRERISDKLLKDDDFLTDSLNVIYEKLRNGQDYTAELKKLIYEKIGRIA